ncbi:MAG: aldose epimerase family protein [Streptococcus sp.]|nr:aldose epimerase family protein [Streptococcus sp.]
MKALAKTIEVINGKNIDQIKLMNDNGITLSLLTLGATWQEFLVPSHEGVRNIIIGFDKPSDYLKNGLCAGQSIGRVAGRIDNGTFTIDNDFIEVPKNENGNCLHGGPQGFHKQIWDYEITSDAREASVTFRYQAKEEVDGFPGNIDVSITYTLKQDNQIYISFIGENATKPTLFNPTNHVYFNLTDDQNLDAHDLYLNSRIYLETREDLVPTGQMIAVDETNYDFRWAKNLGQAIRDNGGFDTAFLTESSLDTVNGSLNLNGKEGINFYSDRNSWVIYTMGGIPNDIYPSRDKGNEAKEFEGIALEAQFLPDAINHEGFGDIVLNPGDKKVYTIRFDYFKVS